MQVPSFLLTVISKMLFDKENVEGRICMIFFTLKLLSRLIFTALYLEVSVGKNAPVLVAIEAEYPLLVSFNLKSVEKRPVLNCCNSGILKDFIAMRLPSPLFNCIRNMPEALVSLKLEKLPTIFKTFPWPAISVHIPNVEVRKSPVVNFLLHIIDPSLLSLITRLNGN